MPSLKFYTITGERGFPSHIIRESVSDLGVMRRQMIATCQETKYADEIVRRLNDSIEISGVGGPI